jgi:sensor domain CHASE-containing protein
MNSTRSFSLKVVAALAISATFLSGVVATTAWAEPSNLDGMHGDMAKHHQERIKTGLDKMAQRLELKASQQAAWQAYAKVLEESMAMPMKMPEADSNADAATFARIHADMATTHAKKLTLIADATAKFQEVLTPDQRKTLDQIARHFRHGHQMRHRGPHQKGTMHEMCRHGQHRDPSKPHD